MADNRPFCEKGLSKTERKEILFELLKEFGTGTEEGYVEMIGDRAIDLMLAAREASSATPHDEYGRCERFKDAKRCDKPAEIQLCLEHLELIKKDTLAAVLALLDAKIEKLEEVINDPNLKNSAVRLIWYEHLTMLRELRAEIVGEKDAK